MALRQFVQCLPLRLSSGWHTDLTEDQDPWGYGGDPGAWPQFRFKQHVQCAMPGQIVIGQIVDYGHDLEWLTVRLGAKRLELHVSRMAYLAHTCQQRR